MLSLGSSPGLCLRFVGRCLCLQHWLPELSLSREAVLINAGWATGHCAVALGVTRMPCARLRTAGSPFCVSLLWGCERGPRGTERELRTARKPECKAAWECPTRPPAQPAYGFRFLHSNWLLWASVSSYAIGISKPSSQRTAGCRGRRNRVNRCCPSYLRPEPQLGVHLAREDGQGVVGAAHLVPEHWGWSVSFFLQARLWSPGKTLRCCTHHTPWRTCLWN